MQRSFRCGGIIKTTSGKYLLVKGSTKWSFPKGHIEKGESFDKCAEREIYEETGLIIKNINKNKRVNIRDNIYYLIDFEDECTVAPIDTTEITDIGWFTFEEIQKLEKNMGVRQYFKKILTGREITMKMRSI